MGRAKHTPEEFAIIRAQNAAVARKSKHITLENEFIEVEVNDQIYKMNKNEEFMFNANRVTFIESYKGKYGSTYHRFNVLKPKCKVRVFNLTTSEIREFEKIMMAQCRTTRSLEYGNADNYLQKMFGKTGADLTVNDLRKDKFTITNELDDEKLNTFLIKKLTGIRKQG